MHVSLPFLGAMAKNTLMSLVYVFSRASNACSCGFCSLKNTRLSLLIDKNRIPFPAASTARIAATISHHQCLTTHWPKAASNLFTRASFFQCGKNTVGNLSCGLLSFLFGDVIDIENIRVFSVYRQCIELNQFLFSNKVY